MSSVQERIGHNPFYTVLSFDRNAFGDGAVLGCDFVGEVTALGSHVTRFAKGDVVAGLIWGGKRCYRLYSFIVSSLELRSLTRFQFRRDQRSRRLQPVLRSR